MTLRRTRIAPISVKRLAKLALQGIHHPGSTLITRPVTKTKRPRDTGPPRSGRLIVHERSGGRCEFAWCSFAATDMHHRRPRRMGGSQAPDTNSPSNLVDLCRGHHAWIESNRAQASSMGLILPANAAPARRCVLLRHDKLPVWLLPDGKWLKYEFVLLDNVGGIRHTRKDAA